MSKRSALSRLAFNGVTRFTALFTALVAVPLVLCIMLSLMGLPVKGFEWLQEAEEPPAKVAKPEVTVVDFTATPASNVMQSFFKELDKTWEPSSSSVTSAGLPHPISCVTPAPTLSDSRAYVANDNETQITVAAYPAGLGGEMFSRFINDTANCKPSSTTIYTYSREGVGVESVTMDASWGDNDIETTFFRRGDVIVFTATSQNVDSYANAVTLDQILQKHLTTTVCPDPNEGVRAQYRNAFFAGAAFTGAVRTEPLKTKKLRKPKLTENLEAKGVEAVKIPSPEVEVELVTLPESDYPYPLWPPLPNPVSIPGLPLVPAEQKLKDDAEVRIPDLVGPGCGWAFLATVEPTYDEEQVEVNNKAIIASVQTALDADGPRWRQDVLAYWDAYHTYLLNIGEYKDYKANVADVAAAWDLIHRAWDKYYTEYANWEIRMEARRTFLANQEAARALLIEQRAACKAYPEVLAAWEVEYAQWQTDYAAWEVQNAQYEQTVAQYEQEQAAYEQAMIQFKADRAEYRRLYRQYEKDLAAWEEADPATRGDPPVEPVKPVRPTAPTPPAPGPEAPVEPVKPVLDHPCPPVKPEILSQDPPPAEPAPEKPEDPRPISERD